ncbi:MAG: NUDIX hydrolase [Thermodesulfovibrionales bacterium]
MEILGQKTLWEGDYLKALLITFRDRDGVVRTWEAVGRVNCAGVVIVVPVTESGEVVFIRQFRPVVGRHVIEFPAGLMSEGEEPAQAGLRELIEETGHAARDLAALTRGAISTGINAEVWTVLLATGVEEAPAEVRRAHPPDEAERIEVIKAPLEGAYEALERLGSNGDYVDIKIYGLIELAKRRMGR